MVDAKINLIVVREFRGNSVLKWWKIFVAFVNEVIFNFETSKILVNFYFCSVYVLISRRSNILFATANRVMVTLFKFRVHFDWFC